MSITEDAPAVAPPEQRPSNSPSGAWWLLVATCVLLLVAVATALTIAWLASRETRTTSYRVLGDLAGIRLDLGDADVEIDGGASAVEVRRVDRFAFGEPSVERRTKEGGRFSIVSRCPDQVLGDCRTVYRLTVPDNVPIEIKTSSGSVRLSGVRATVQVSTESGAISATAFCGFSLRASSGSGDVSARRRMLGRPARAALAQRRRARGGAVRALPDRRPERLGVDPHPRRHPGPGRPVPDPGAEHDRRRDGGGVVVTAALDVSPHLRAARRALLYLIVGLGQGLTYLLVVGGGLVLGVLLTPLWIGLPLLAGTARLAWRLAEGERRQANRLLETHLPPVSPPAPGSRLR